MKINKLETNATKFAYDGCHKIYIIETDNNEKEAIELGYTIKPIEEIEITFKESCSLRFINNWDLNKQFVKQFQKANFKN